jgi:hypothetical protein
VPVAISVLVQCLLQDQLTIGIRFCFGYYSVQDDDNTKTTNNKTGKLLNKIKSNSEVVKFGTTGTRNAFFCYNLFGIIDTTYI